MVLKFQNHTLTPEDRMYFQEYIEDVVQDLQEIYNVDQVEASKLLKGSAFLTTMERDPDYVVDHDTEYWAERLYMRKIVYQYN